MSYTTLPAKATLKPKKFEANVNYQQIELMKQILRLSDLGPKTYENTTTTDDRYFGVTYDFMENAKKTWLEEYDWRKTEARINSYPNYTVDIEHENENYTVHFIALYSEKKDAIPLVLLHGWPGSFLEFLELLDLVKSQYPSATDLPYHIIVPSLPGYAYSSSASVKTDMTREATAAVIDKLMHGLGFGDGDGYIAQGGDIGSAIARILASQYPSCKACHLNMLILPKPDDIPDSAMDEFERKGQEHWEKFATHGKAYADEHATRPATIGFVLSASPLALLAWIAEKFLTWTDTSPPLPTILDSVTLYWLTQSFPRAIYPYRASGTHNKADYHITGDKVFGYSVFPYEMGVVPKAWAETTGNLVFYRQHEAGGHFAAMERPRELWGDVQEFVGLVWKGKGGKDGDEGVEAKL